MILGSSNVKKFSADHPGKLAANLADGLQSHPVPSSQRVHREGEERHPLRLAARPVLLHLFAVTVCHRMTPVEGDLANQGRLESIHHGNVDGRVSAMGPVWQQDVRCTLVRAGK